MIRFMQAEDIPALVAVSKTYFDEMGYDAHGNGWMPEPAVKFWENCINNNSIVGLIKEYDGIKGVCVVALRTKHLWHEGPLQANEIIWHSDPSLPSMQRARIQVELFDAMTEELSKKGCKWLYFGCGAEQTTVQKFLERRGCKLTTLAYGKEI